MAIDHLDNFNNKTPIIFDNKINTLVFLLFIFPSYIYIHTETLSEQQFITFFLSSVLGYAKDRIDALYEKRGLRGDREKS